jgi:NADPH:quinone reductase-like Zn-dependent oxidoreductase
MQAIVQTEYGSAAVLRLAEVDRPGVGADQVLVQVRAAAVHAGDWHLMRGEPWLVRLIYGGLQRPKIKTLGCDVAGVVTQIGQNVTQFQPGDHVFGDLSEVGFGTFAEYVAAPEKALVLKPENVTFESAAAVPVSAVTALQGLRDVGQLQAGQRVLITGAGGGVGSFAVQIAKLMGAEVTAMCSSSKLDLVRSLNPTHVIDSTHTNIAEINQRYDLVLDTAAYRSVLSYRHIVEPGGRYVMVGGEIKRIFQVMLLGPILSQFAGYKLKLLTANPNQSDLTVLSDWLQAGQVKPCIDRVYALHEVPDAIDYVEQGKANGKVVISL